jgi:hypothetical protein
MAKKIHPKKNQIMQEIKDHINDEPHPIEKSPKPPQIVQEIKDHINDEPHPIVKIVWGMDFLGQLINFINFVIVVMNIMTLYQASLEAKEFHRGAK